MSTYSDSDIAGLSTSPVWPAEHNRVNYMEGLLLKSQQMDALLVDTTVPVEITGTVSHKDILGTVSATARTTRHQRLGCAL